MRDHLQVLPGAWADRADVIEAMARGVYENRWARLSVDEREAIRYDMVRALHEAETRIFADLRRDLEELRVSFGSLDRREFIDREAVMAILKGHTPH